MLFSWVDTQVGYLFRAQTRQNSTTQYHIDTCRRTNRTTWRSYEYPLAIEPAAMESANRNHIATDKRLSMLKAVRGKRTDRGMTVHRGQCRPWGASLNGAPENLTGGSLESVTAAFNLLTGGSVAAVVSPLRARHHHRGRSRRARGVQLVKPYSARVALPIVMLAPFLPLHQGLSHALIAQGLARVALPMDSTRHHHRSHSKPSGGI